MGIISYLHLGIVEKYCTSHFLVFPLCYAKKNPLGNARPIEDVSVTEKKIIQKGLRYFTAKEFLVKQINTEYSGDISQLKLEND